MNQYMSIIKGNKKTRTFNTYRIKRYVNEYILNLSVIFQTHFLMNFRFHYTVM